MRDVDSYDDSDFPTSENVEDRRDDPRSVSFSEATSDFAKDFGYSAGAAIDKAIGAGIHSTAPSGSLEQQGGRNDFAAGGPVRSLKKGERARLAPITQHPLLPKVRIEYAPVPYLAGSSNDMRTVYIDPAVPRTLQVLDKMVPSAAPLAVHEIYEREAIEEIIRQVQAGTYKVKGGGPDKVHSEIYETAHNDVGLQAEMHFLFEHYGFTPKHWQRYQQIMHELAQRTERETLKQSPKDLYTYMYPHLHPHHASHSMHGGGKIDLGASALKRGVDEARAPDSDQGGPSEEDYRWKYQSPDAGDAGVLQEPDMPSRADRNTYYPEDVMHNREIHTEEDS